MILLIFKHVSTEPQPINNRIGPGTVIWFNVRLCLILQTGMLGLPIHSAASATGLFLIPPQLHAQE